MRVFLCGTSPQISASTTWAHQQITIVPLSVFEMHLVKVMDALSGVTNHLNMEELSGRNRLSPRYINIAITTAIQEFEPTKMLGQQQKHAQKKRNEGNSESTK
jgi:hypothetical protein